MHQEIAEFAEWDAEKKENSPAYSASFFLCDLCD
jgi:hypothetical protein